MYEVIPHTSHVRRLPQIEAVIVSQCDAESNRNLSRRSAQQNGVKPETAHLKNSVMARLTKHFLVGLATSLPWLAA
jgi:hypothetical protein